MGTSILKFKLGNAMWLCYFSSYVIVLTVLLCMLDRWVAVLLTQRTSFHMFILLSNFFTRCPPQSGALVYSNWVEWFSGPPTELTQRLCIKTRSESRF